MDPKLLRESLAALDIEEDVASGELAKALSDLTKGYVSLEHLFNTGELYLDSKADAQLHKLMEVVHYVRGLAVLGAIHGPKTN